MSWLEKITKINTPAIIINSDDNYRVEELITFIMRNHNTNVVYIDYPTMETFMLRRTENIGIVKEPFDGLSQLTVNALYDFIATRTERIVINAIGVEPADDIVTVMRSLVLFTDYKVGTDTRVFVVTDHTKKFVDQSLPVVNVMPSYDEYSLILNNSKKKNKINVEALYGLTLSDVMNVLLIAENDEDVLLYKKERLMALGMDFEVPRRGFESVGGYKYLKDYFTENYIYFFKNKELAKAYGITTPRGFILFGIPGTGKTWFAKALAKELAVPFVSLDPSKFKGSLYGESEQKTRKIIETLKLLRYAVVFIDEIDALFSKRTSEEHEVTRDIKNMMLSYLGDEDRESIVIGTTNRPEDLDEAIVRVGRFDDFIPVLLPDSESRRQIINVHLNVINPVNPKFLKINNEDLDEIVEATKLWTSAEVAELVKEAKKVAMKQAKSVDIDAFRQALTIMQGRIDLATRRKQLSDYKELMDRKIPVKTAIKDVVYKMIDENLATTMRSMALREKMA